MKKLLLTTALLAIVPVAANAAGNVTKGDIQRLDLDQITLDSTTVTATGAEINTVADGITATAAEINNVADRSGRVVELVEAAETLTSATHGDKILYLSTTEDQTITLPDCGTATGDVFEFRFDGPNFSSGTATIQVPTDDNTTVIGFLNAWDENDTEGDLVYRSVSATGSDTVKFSSSNTEPGDIVRLACLQDSELYLNGAIAFESTGQETVLFTSAVASTD